MYSVEVAPIQRGLLLPSLTFFSREAIPVGALVSAPLKKRMVPALVTATVDVREQKLDLKASGFSLKKLGAAAPRAIFTSAFMRAVESTARFHAASTGSLVAQLSFNLLLRDARKIELAVESEKPARAETLVLQAEFPDRVHAYRNLVRECFARGRSVLLLCPTLIEVDELARELSRGIEERVVRATSGMAARALITAWNKTALAKDGLLLIGTPPVLSFPLTNVDTVIVERESARSFVTRARPALDTRRAAEAYAKEIGARIILADFPLRVETFARSFEGTVDDLVRPVSRSNGTGHVTIVDARKTDEMKASKRRFSPLQEQTLEHIGKTLDADGTVAVFAARRGVAPLTICNDCGTPVTDPSTGVPMVLHKTPQGNVFMSHRSGAVVTAERSCAECGGWNLVTLGIGVERVHDEIKRAFPKARTALFAKDTTPTHASAKRLSDAFFKSGAGVMVGTERMLPYLTRTVDLSIVASIDSLLSLPAWRAGEHALSILFGLLARTSGTLIVETRKPDNAVIKSVASGSPMEYLRDEVRERRSYGYPPFKTFIGLTWEGTPTRCEVLRKKVVELFDAYDIVGPLPPQLVDRTRLEERAVIRLEPNVWPNDELLGRLRELPPEVRVSVDPDDIV